MGEQETRFFAKPTSVLWILGPVILITGLCFALFRPVNARAATETIASDFNYRVEDRMFKRGNEASDEIALTFDDGPHPGSLNRILEVLASRRIKATFFLVGRRIKEHPDAVRRILEAGHEVGNHTQNHLRLTELTPEEAEQEIADCEESFRAATGGRSMTLFRPPGMQVSPVLLEITNNRGLVTVAWTNACKDFETEQTQLEDTIGDEFFDRLYRGMRGGAILLLHDTAQTAAALDDIIVYLQAAGYRFVKVTQMLSHLPQPVLVEANPTSKTETRR